ncbi:MAG: GNAT family N-acetyltransferase [Aeriscardovia sp.]|nr:GNAT family N-acetyltransferase [Aeriscardovia sp.]MBR3461083.1 GNAT family N-acetyltransferase [Clostridiales bacterium]
MLTYRVAEDKDLNEICKLCADAFMEYDFYRPFVSDPAKRWKFIYELHVHCFTAEIKRKQAVVGEENGEIITAFSLHEPGRTQAGFTEYVSSGGLGMLLRYGFTPLSWFSMYDKCVAPAERFNNSNHDVYYVEILAVRSDKQRQGIGTKDIHEYMIPHVRSKGGGYLSLITNSVGNTMFYESNGFTCFDHIDVPAAKTKIGNWCFSMNVDR